MTSRSSFTIFSGGGEMGEAIRNFDWSKTPIGPVEHWPQSLITSIQIMLASRQPIWVAWGAELVYFYNDPYKTVIGARHPSALGKPMREVWPELWHDIEPTLQRALAGTDGVYVEEQLLIMERHGFKEETYYTYSFTPIPNDGAVGGIICFNTDDTRRVIGQRRVSLLRELATCATARNPKEACDRAKAALATNSKDLPFALVYLLDSSGKKLELMGAAGISRDHPAAPASMPVTDDSPWPVAQVLQSNSFRIVDIGHHPDFPRGFWAQSPTKAVVLPLITGAEAAHAGIVIAGLNPFRQWSERYQSFLSVVVTQIAAAVAHGLAYEAERKSFEREQAARREAENAMRAKDKFLATLSHELRTPLSPALLIASDAVADPDLPPNLRSRFQVILKNIEVEAQLIDDLLDLSRVTYGKLNLNMRPVDVHRVIREALHIVESQIVNKSIQMAVDLKAEEHLISADPMRLQQIFWNVLRNAVKFTPEQGKIGIETFQVGGNGRFGVTITDSGMGMTPEELNKAFTAFSQGEHTEDESANQGGLGLGLAISKKLVELQSGSIEAKSDGRGRGSTFTIEFPLAHGSSE